MITGDRNAPKWTSRQKSYSYTPAADGRKSHPIHAKYHQDVTLASSHRSARRRSASHVSEFILSLVLLQNFTYGASFSHLFHPFFSLVSFHSRIRLISCRGVRGGRLRESPVPLAGRGFPAAGRGFPTGGKGRRNKGELEQERRLLEHEACDVKGCFTPLR